MAQRLEDKMGQIDALIGSAGAFDIKKRPIQVGGRNGVCIYIIGYTDLVLLERIFFSLQSVDKTVGGMKELVEGHLSFPGTEIVTAKERAAVEILRGGAVLLVDGWEEYLVMDARSFAMRGTDEPEKDRTLRGPHIGLNESLISNLIQIRRYLRTPDLSIQNFLVGKKAPFEVAVLSLTGRADENLKKNICKKLENASVSSLTLTQESLATLLFPQKKAAILNPFPRVRYTERPDVVAATLMEGKIAIVCDNSPSVMLLPECIFDFFEEADDYYFPPVTATYLRVVRIFVFFASIFLIPIWLLVVEHASRVPDTFHFILAKGDSPVPLFLQFLIIELCLDGLKMASLNTPSTLSNSFSVIGGLLLGEFAVESGWFVPQTILYSAFTGIANYVPTNYELGYSFKFMRMSLILLVEFFGIRGFLGGILLWLSILMSTRSAAGKGYLYPLFPFDKKGFVKLFFRQRQGKESQW